MKLDILAFGAHPDDVELGCGGTLIKMESLGYKTGVVDLTAGELGTRGDSTTRLKEAEQARIILKAAIRENLGLMDGFFEINKESVMRVIHPIRKYRPEVILCTAISDRHPDHSRAAKLVVEASFLSGLKKVVIADEGVELSPWRPKAIYHYIQDRYLKPDFITDISGFYEQKLKAVMAFTSQFYNPDSKEPETPISSVAFLEFLKGRSLDAGRLIGADYGEGFIAERSIGVDDLMVLR